ncbi:MAG: uridine kinase, partial [Pelobium sp.]
NPNAVPKILQIKPAPILIIEGLFIYHFKNIDPLFNYRVFMDADMEIALERRLKRDLLERGYSEDDVHYKWENHVMPAYQQYLLPHRQRCDKVINNSTNELQNVLNITDDISKELRAKINLSAI